MDYFPDYCQILGFLALDGWEKCKVLGIFPEIDWHMRGLGILRVLNTWGLLYEYFVKWWTCNF